MQKLCRLFLVFWTVALAQNLQAQTLQTSANFQQPNVPVTISPEHPGICDIATGVSVTVIEEFTSYIWEGPNNETKIGRTAQLNNPGDWKLIVEFEINGVSCSKEISFYVYDLKDPGQIRKYFVDQDFWPVTIYKVPVDPGDPPLACRNCTCEDQLEEVGFDTDLAFIKLNGDIEFFEEFIPFQDLDYQKSITSNSCLCNLENGSTLSEYESALQSGDMALWGHQFFVSEGASQGTLYLKGRMSWQESSPVGAHRTRLDVIKSDILNYNVASTAQQAKVLFTNIFMSNPIGGYDIESECDYSHLVASESIILTPAAVPLQLSSSFNNLNFVTINDENAEFEGSLKSFEIELKKYHAYKYLENKFSGYYHDISSELVENFSIFTNNLACRSCLIKLPIICNSECTIYEIQTEEQYPSSLSGGIGYDIHNKNSVPGVTCFDIGCGKFAGDKEIEDLINSGVALTNEDKISLRDFFSVMYCEDKEIFDCFREGQLNPGSNIDLFLEDVKSKLLSSPNAILDGCDDLSPYVDRWYELAAFDANLVPAVKSKLQQLGDEYWIQTLENATNAGSFWWKTAPAVNMDFFGIKITSLPNKPYPPFNQFNSQEFFNYMQLNFATSSFMGEGNACAGNIPGIRKYFEYNTPDEYFNWTDGNGLTTVFTISMPDDGNVICTQHNVQNRYWTFSTLNAPGWLEGESWDGFHPVSGNRRFGLVQNSDGTFTFYTSGVDRLTGWWHKIFVGEGFAFSEADDLWKCFLDNIKNFVLINSGSISNDYDCTTVRPKWLELRNAIKKGCEGLSNSINYFPCKQAESCK